jgi:hypothetical protein
MYGIQNLIEESVSQVTATNSVELGAQRYYAGLKYAYVYNKSSSTASVGYAMVRIGANASATCGFSGTVSSTAGDADILGMVYHNDIPARQYGWVVVQGAVPAAYCNSGTSVGISVALDANGAFRSRSATTGALYPSVGVALTAASAATALCTFTVYVNCG